MFILLYYIKEIQSQTITQGRQWNVVGCDGLPYNLATRLSEQNEELRNLLIVPGAGHIEINAVKAIFKLLSDVSFKELAKLLGYRTHRALVCCFKCTDHHKAWQLLKIYFFGTMDEILRQFLCDSYKNKKQQSINEFYNYISESGPSIRFMCDSLFNYVFPIFLYRCAIRRNNSRYILAGRSMFMRLFFVTNMTNYQELIFKDLKARVLAPAEVKTFLEKTESFSVSGNISKGEGGDFVLESVNGKTKRWLPPGIPTEKHWLKVCRNVDTLDKVNNFFLKIYSMQNLKSYQSFTIERCTLQ
jgi:hypothetical protein